MRQPNYVVATLGKDTNDGLLQTTAWKTIAKVNGSRFQQGDQILCKGDGTWRETLMWHLPSPMQIILPISSLSKNR
jgi:hypothetical protein